jgi:hypothetical protein
MAYTAVMLGCVLLQVLYGGDGIDDRECTGVHHISGLTGLQHLSICTNWNDYEMRYTGRMLFENHICCPTLPAQLLVAFTGLTRLESDLCNAGSLAGISSCINLQHLEVCMVSRRGLQAADWVELATLTQLTELRLLKVVLSEPSPEAFEALSKLTKLQVAAAARWSPAFLPALTTCTRLTELSGVWEYGRGHGAEHAGFGHIVLPQLEVLDATFEPGVACFECVPNLRHLRADVCVNGKTYLFPTVMTPASMQSLCRHCTCLQTLVLSALHSSFESFDGEVQAPAGRNQPSYVAAIQRLTSLQHLTCLKFTPVYDAELLALVQACCVLLDSHSLQELHVAEQFSEDLSGTAWMQLGQLRRLRKLSVQVSHACDELAAEAFVFLGALAGCGTVALKLPARASLQPFEVALEALHAAGLPVPCVELSNSSSQQPVTFSVDPHSQADGELELAWPVVLPAVLSVARRTGLITYDCPAHVTGCHVVPKEKEPEVQSSEWLWLHCAMAATHLLTGVWFESMYPLCGPVDQMHLCGLCRVGCGIHVGLPGLAMLVVHFMKSARAVACSSL